MSKRQPLLTAIVGAGNRSVVYSKYALQHPDRMRIVAVADPDDVRRRGFAQRFEIPAKHCFGSADELARHPRLAGAVINGTMDQIHVDTSLPLLETGHDILLEKPVARSHAELQTLVDAVRKSGRKLMVCHILRHAPFYVGVKEAIANGAVGRIMAIHTSENVSYDHMGESFVRGKWNRQEVCPMLLQKCCHDLDLICWFMSGIAPRRVSSFGSRMFFREEHAPTGSGSRCLVDCEVEADCHYSARKNFIDNHDYDIHVWRGLEHLADPTDEQKLEYLRTESPHGRCVWRCDNDIVDHQSVMIEFEDGAVATHEMVGGTSKPCRTVHIRGTKGEIQGTMEDGTFVIREPDPSPGRIFREHRVEVDVSDDTHGGGDLRLVEDFVRVVRGEQPSASTTDLMDSVHSHEIAFAAEKAVGDGTVVGLDGSGVATG